MLMFVKTKNGNAVMLYLFQSGIPAEKMEYKSRGDSRVLRTKFINSNEEIYNLMLGPCGRCLSPQNY